MRSLSILVLLAGSIMVGSTQAAPQIGTFGFDEPGMDRSVKPGSGDQRRAAAKWTSCAPAS